MSVYEAWLQTGGVAGDLAGFIAYLTGRGYVMDMPDSTSWAVKNGFPATGVKSSAGTSGGYPNVPTGGTETPGEILARIAQGNKTPTVTKSSPGQNTGYGAPYLTTGAADTMGLPTDESGATPDRAGYGNPAESVNAVYSPFGGEKPSREVYFGYDKSGVHAGPDYYMEKGLQESGLVGGPFTAFMRSQGNRARLQWEIAKLVSSMTGQPADLGVLAKVMRGETVYGPEAIQQIVNFAQNDPVGKEMFNTPGYAELLYNMIGSTRGPVTSAYDNFMQSRFEPSYNLYKGNAYENPTQPYSDYLKKSGYWGR